MVALINMPQFQASPLLDLTPIAAALRERQRQAEVEQARALQLQKFEEEKRQFNLQNARADAADGRSAAMAPIQLRGAELENKVRERQLAQPLDDGSKLMEVNGQIVRVTRDGKAMVVHGVDPVGQARVDVQKRVEALKAAGMDPTSNQGRTFAASGKMPREDQQPLTATDKKAILEADEAVLQNREGIAALDHALKISPQAYSGPLAGARGTVTGIFGSEAGQKTTELTNTITENALRQLKSIFGGNPTEGERRILLDIQGSVNMPQQVRDQIYRRAAAMAERRLQFNEQKARELRGQDYYKPKGVPSPDNGGFSIRRID